jgi:hypothetical protein
MRALPLAVIFAIASTACGDSETADEAKPSATCEPPSRVVGELCLEPGVTDEGVAAGVAAEMCGAGFVSDGDVGCEPILPTEPCPPGLMAVPGDDVCRSVAPCGQGQWGNIPIDGNTVFVDQSFAGASDGSMGAPYTTVSEAVLVAPAGGLVAVAAGSYLEDVTISNKPVRLHGVCPEQVEIVGTGADVAAIIIINGASGSDVHGIALRGAANGVIVSGAEQVLLEQVWIHDNAGRGVELSAQLGATSATVVASLLEKNYEFAVAAYSSAVTVHASAIRDTVPNTAGLHGRGLNCVGDVLNQSGPSVCELIGSLLERQSEAGMYVGGSEGVVEASVIRDTMQNTPGLGGRGLAFEDALPSLVRSSLLQGNREVGLFNAGGVLTVEATVVRSTLASEEASSGVLVQDFPNSAGRAHLDLVASLVDANYGNAVVVIGADIIVDASVLRDSVPAPDDNGRGLIVTFDLETMVGASGVVRFSRFTRNSEVSLGGAGSTLTLYGTLIEDTFATSAGLYGDGVVLDAVPQLAASIQVDWTAVRGSTRAGVSNFGALVSLGNTQIVCGAFALNGEDKSDADYLYEDRGGNTCGCPEPNAQCTVVSASLEPPSLLDPSN